MVLGLAGVGADEFDLRVATVGLDQAARFLYAVFADVGQHHIRAFARVCQCDFTADAGSRSGDDRGLAPQFELHGLQFSDR